MLGLALAFLAASLAILASAAGAGAVTSSTLTEPQEQVLDYWTPERMANARPLAPVSRTRSSAPGRTTAARRAGKPTYVVGSEPGGALAPRLRQGGVGEQAGGGAQAGGHLPFTIRTIPDTSAYPTRTNGKVFASRPGVGDFVCSGTVVPGNTQSTVMTAGHCVFADVPGFATNLIFVPGYNAGAEPHGRWVAKRLTAAPGFVNDDGNITVDVGAAELLPDAAGRRIEDVVGSRGVAFNQSRNQSVDAFGYPAAPAEGLPFSGELLWTCDTSYGGDDLATSGLAGPLTIRIGCPFTGGASGGGWVFGELSPGAGFLESVVSYGYPDEPDHLFGPYFGNAARNVWVAAQDSCKGKLATHVGTDAAEKIVGTPGKDVIAANGGDDKVNGLAGNDRICGGDGADKLGGGRGRDRLNGEGGRDTVNGGRGGDRLNGGSGRDVCGGGAGRDRDHDCEKTRSVP
jgi:V8-like Glu-specific endopeptidase